MHNHARYVSIFQRNLKFFHSLVISARININYIFYKQYHFKNSPAITKNRLSFWKRKIKFSTN